MLLLWRIRYLDSRDKEFKDRDLWLDTTTLNSVTKAAVEVTNDLRDIGDGGEMLRYRHLFHEGNPFKDVSDSDRSFHGSLRTVFIHDYFEDENGKQLTRKRMAEILTGNRNTILLPSGARQYDIDYALADSRPIPVAEITLSQDALDTLGYFARELRELMASTLLRDGPGTITGYKASDLRLQTAVSDEGIRSFVTIFRRLYMTQERSCFVKAVDEFAKAVKDNPLAGLVRGIASDYERALDEPPSFIPMLECTNLSFSRKRLIDVFLYTQYAHPPDAKRSRQFESCLQEVGGNRDMLTWLFLTELWTSSLHMTNAGRIIGEFYEQYCRSHGVAGDVLDSVSRESPGIGTLETREARRERLLGETAGSLARAIWEERGRPEGGAEQFRDEASQRLNAALGGRQNHSHCTRREPGLRDDSCVN